MNNADRAATGTFPSRRVALATQYLVTVVDKYCGVREGTTSLYWHLVSVIHKHAKNAPAVMDTGIRLDEPAAPGQPAAETGEACPTCRGTGTLNMPDDVPADCHRCKGTGRVYSSLLAGGPLADEARRIAREYVSETFSHCSWTEAYKVIQTNKLEADIRSALERQAEKERKKARAVIESLAKALNKHCFWCGFNPAAPGVVNRSKEAAQEYLAYVDAVAGRDAEKERR